MSSKHFHHSHTNDGSVELSAVMGATIPNYYLGIHARFTVNSMRSLSRAPIASAMPES